MWDLLYFLTTRFGTMHVEYEDGIFADYHWLGFNVYASSTSCTISNWNWGLDLFHVYEDYPLTGIAFYLRRLDNRLSRISDITKRICNDIQLFGVWTIFKNWNFYIHSF
jgi:hypothetical protein